MRFFTTGPIFASLFWASTALTPGASRAEEPQSFQASAEPQSFQTSEDSEEFHLTKSLRQLDHRLNFVRTNHFALIHGMDDAWAAEMSSVLERIHDDFHVAFSRAGFKVAPTREVLVWVCFTDRDHFDEYAWQADRRRNIDWLEEYYSSRTNRVTMVREEIRRERNAGAESMPMATDVTAYHNSGENERGPSSAATLDLRRATHEAAHQLAFNSGIQRRGVMYPFWVAEGLATNFEADSDGNYGLGLDNEPRAATLTATFDRDELVPIEDFIAMTRAPSGGRRLNEVYAQAWGFFHFLLKRHPEQLTDYLARLADTEPGRRDEWQLREEFVASFGATETVDREWREFLAEMDSRQSHMTASR